MQEQQQAKVARAGERRTNSGVPRCCEKHNLALSSVMGVAPHPKETNRRPTRSALPRSGGREGERAGEWGVPWPWFDWFTAQVRQWAVDRLASLPPLLSLSSGPASALATPFVCAAVAAVVGHPNLGVSCTDSGLLLRRQRWCRCRSAKGWSVRRPRGSLLVVGPGNWRRHAEYDHQEHRQPRRSG